MNFAAVFSAIVAVIKAIPVLDDWFQRFLVWYAEKQLEHMKSENREAIVRAIKLHDQRPIEDAIGSPISGEFSGIGTIVDYIDGVSQHSAEKKD